MYALTQTSLSTAGSCTITTWPLVCMKGLLGWLVWLCFNPQRLSVPSTPWKQMEACSHTPGLVSWWSYDITDSWWSLLTLIDPGMPVSIYWPWDCLPFTELVTLLDLEQSTLVYKLTRYSIKTLYLSIGWLKTMYVSHIEIYHTQHLGRALPHVHLLVCIWHQYIWQRRDNKG